MITGIIQEIKQTWREGIHEAFRTGKLFFYSYFLVYQLLFFGTKVTQLRLYYSIVLPLIGSLLLLDILPNQISKTLFLCPMSKAERESYLRKRYWFRVITSIISAAVVLAVFVILQKLPLIRAIGSLVIYIGIVISYHLFIPIPNSQKGTRLQGFVTWNIISLFNGAFAMLLNVSIAKLREETIYVYILLGILVGIQLIATMILMARYYKVIFKELSDYEVNERIYYGKKSRKYRN